MSTSYADALVDEEAWFLADLSVDGIPGLTKDAGGPFDVVAAQVRRLQQKPRQLFLAHDTSRDARGSKDSRRLDHDLMALVLWPYRNAQAMHEDQDRLDAAVDAVLARIRGPLGDRTHGGRWWIVGDSRVEPPNPSTILTFADAMAAVGTAIEVVVRWTVTAYEAA